MKNIPTFSMKRRAGALVAGLVASAVLTAASAGSASASTSLSVTVAQEFGVDKVTSSLVIEGYSAVISKLPEQAATPAEALALNSTKPTLTCTAGSTTVTSTGAYVSIDDLLALHFGFSTEVSASTDSCVLSNTTYVAATGSVTYPLSAAGRTALWGDPTKVETDTNARLTALTPKVRPLFKKSWGSSYMKRISAIKGMTWKSAILPWDATSTDTKTVYVLRPDDHPVNWINLCQRVPDSRLLCMRYNPRTDKTRFFTLTDANIYTDELTTETAAS